MNNSETKRRICVVVTARASYARFRSALLALRDNPHIELLLVLSGASILGRFGDIRMIVEADGLTPAHVLHTVVEGENLTSSARTTGLSTMELASTFDILKPDMVVTIADRYETLATATAAAFMNIPLAHIQGGEVTGNIDEKVRHAITKLADVHLVSTQQAYDFVLRMGERADAVHLTGCPSIDIARNIRDSSKEISYDLIEQYGGVGPFTKLPKRYLVVLQHPTTEGFGSDHEKVVEMLDVVGHLETPVLWFWPNIDAGSDHVSNAIRQARENGLVPHIHFIKNMSPDDFLRLLIGSIGIFGNSSVGIRECSYLGVPAINIGERQRDRERGPNVIDVAHDKEEMLSALQRLIDQNVPRVSTNLYGDGYAGEKISQTLASVPLSFVKRLSYVDQL